MSKKFDAKHIALLAILTALAYVGRIVFQFLPNVQPMTAIIIILTLNMGLIDGLIVASLSLFLSNIFLGLGPWTFAQLISFAAIVLLTSLVMKPLYLKKTKPLFVLFAFFSGIFYGFIISLFSYKIYGLTNFWIYYAYGLWFDLAHGFGNAAFYLILGPILRPLFNRFKEKS